MGRLERKDKGGQVMATTKVDMVNSPPHYTAGSIECIEAIEAALGPEGFKAFCRGNALKYTWRSEMKNNSNQDLAKAIWYLNRIGETEHK